MIYTGYGDLGNCVINFDNLHAALEQLNLLDCQGSVVRVSGLTVESAGPPLGLGELCGIHLRDGRRITAEVVGFNNDNLILLPIENASGISPGDAVTGAGAAVHQFKRACFRQGS